METMYLVSNRLLRWATAFWESFSTKSGVLTTAIIAVSNFNLTIRYANSDYIISEHSSGPFCLPDTPFNLYVKDLLPLSLCLRQTYDGTAVMQRSCKCRQRFSPSSTRGSQCCIHLLNLFFAQQIDAVGTHLQSDVVPNLSVLGGRSWLCQRGCQG